MFQPDLGYYLRALWARKWIIVIGLVAGAGAGVLGGSVASGGHWRASQLLRVEDIKVPIAFDDLVEIELPERDVLEEAGLLRIMSSELVPGSAVSATPDELARTIRVTASASTRAEAMADVSALIDAYEADRTAQFASQVGQAISALESLAGAAQTALDDLDSEVTTGELTVAAQSLVAQRAAIAESRTFADGARAYFEQFRRTQTGGVSRFGVIEFTQQPVTGSGRVLAIVLGILGAVLGAIVALVIRTRRRRIESEADLALFPAMVSVGELDALQPRVLDRIGAATSATGDVIITESLVGSAGARLQQRLAAHGIDAVVHGCLDLPVLGANQRVVVAVDRQADTEHSIDDLLELIERVAPRPVLAVLC